MDIRNNQWLNIRAFLFKVIFAMLIIRYFILYLVLSLIFVFYIESHYILGNGKVDESDK